MRDYTIVLLCLTSLAWCQYPPENGDDVLPYNPPGQMPPMPPTDPPGSDSELLYGPTPSPQPSSTGLRAPPMPTWTQETDESSGQQSAEISQNNDGSGEGSGEKEASGFDIASGENSGEEDLGDSFDASGAQDDFPQIMLAMDEEAAVLGVNCPADVMFIIDATSSVREVFQESINYVEKVIEGLDIQPTVDHVGAILFSSQKKQRVKIRLGEHKDSGSLMNAIDKLPFFAGITSTGHALEFASKHTDGRRDNVTLNFVVITDGWANDDLESGAATLREIPNSNVFAVAVGETYLQKGLESIAKNTDNVLIGSMSYGTLVKKIKNCEARKQAVLRRKENPDNTELVHPGEFLSDRFQQRQKADQNVIGKTDEDVVVGVTEQVPVKECKFDVGIIFDSSGSLERNFHKQLSFASQLVDQLPISENSTRVAIVQFAGKTKMRVLVDFVQNKSSAEIKKIIEKSPFYSGTTFTNQALMRMSDLFEKSKKDGRKKNLLLFTDGYSAEDTKKGIDALKKQGVTIYTVGISTDKETGLNMKELHSMAESPEHCYNASNFPELLKRFPSTQYC